jgi:hypothetical protein
VGHLSAENKNTKLSLFDRLPVGSIWSQTTIYISHDKADEYLITGAIFFLKTGVTLAYFHSDGKVESVNDKLISLHKGYLSIDAASFRSLGINRSGPIALDGIV